MESRFAWGFLPILFLILFLIPNPVHAEGCQIASDCYTGNPHLDQCHTFSCEQGQCVTTPKANQAPCNADGDPVTCGACIETGAYGFACVENNPWLCMVVPAPEEGFCNRASDCMVGNPNLDQCHTYHCNENKCVTREKRDYSFCNVDGNAETCGTCQSSAFGFACVEEANTCATSENVSCGGIGEYPCGDPANLNNKFCFDNGVILPKKEEFPDNFEVSWNQKDGIYPGPGPVCGSSPCGGLGDSCCIKISPGDDPLYCYGGLICDVDWRCTTNRGDNLSPHDQSCGWKKSEYRSNEVGYNLYHYKITLDADCPETRTFVDEFTIVVTDGMNFGFTPQALNLWFNPETRDIERREVPSEGQPMPDENPEPQPTGPVPDSPIPILGR